MQYTTNVPPRRKPPTLCYQDFKDTFVCNTQLNHKTLQRQMRCVIRISKILLYAIHNYSNRRLLQFKVVLSGFQRYFCMQYTTYKKRFQVPYVLCYQDFNEQFDCKSTKKIGNMQIYTNIFCYFCSNKFEGYTQ